MLLGNFGFVKQNINQILSILFTKLVNFTFVPVTCHISHVNCHMSPVTCHMSHVICQFFSFISFSDIVVKLVGPTPSSFKHQNNIFLYKTLQFFLRILNSKICITAKVLDKVTFEREEWLCKMLVKCHMSETTRYSFNRD